MRGEGGPEGVASLLTLEGLEGSLGGVVVLQGAAHACPLNHDSQHEAFLVLMRLKGDVEIRNHVPEMVRWGLLNCTLAVLRSAGRAAPAEAEPSIDANLGAINRAEDMVEAVECQLGEWRCLSRG